MNRNALAATPLLLALSGCLTGGNVKGDFQCQAPGGSCAPMSSIDASAVAAIGSVRTISDPGATTPSIPRPLAGPVLADGSAPPRTSDRVLRVVFPAHIDSDGIYREESAAHAVVENAAWAEALGGPARPARGVPALRPSGIVPASTTASTSAVGKRPGSILATMDEIIASRAPNGAAPSNDAAAPGQPVAVAPRATVGVDPVASYTPPIVTGSRSPSPISLAEVAAGLSAPRVAALDPRAPSANYDTPDVAAIRGPTPTPSISASVRPGLAAAQATSMPLDQSSSAASVVSSPSAARMSGSGTAAAAPFGTRPVRWKGKTYQLPYRNPQSASVPAASSPSVSNATAELNKAALAKAAPLPPAKVTTAAASPAAAAPTGGQSYGPTTDASEAQARVQAMVAPVLSKAVEDGRDAAREAAPTGFALPLPRKGAPQ